ncbi:hypothetical protein [Bosea sp. 117]|uniref:hypothetical protein n=1 Tax=Bosea sp. 117 TaxID=1125973 RepID=UPI0012DE7559|nr:hypothetical protein [Bosea sp. 117]
MICPATATALRPKMPAVALTSSAAAAAALSLATGHALTGHTAAGIPARGRRKEAA